MVATTLDSESILVGDDIADPAPIRQHEVGLELLLDGGDAGVDRDELRLDRERQRAPAGAARLGPSLLLRGLRPVTGAQALAALHTAEHAALDVARHAVAEAGFDIRQPIVAALIGAPAGRIVDRIGTARMTTVGLVAIATGASLLTMMPEALGVPAYVAPSVLLTAGYALFQVANNTAVMAGVGHQQRGVVSGTLNLSRNLGLITGAAVMGATFEDADGYRVVFQRAPWQDAA